MNIIQGQKSRFRQDREVMMMDDAEMALELIDLAQTTKLKDHPRPAAPQFQSAELLTELLSGACMIMDREECEVLVREVEQAHANHAKASRRKRTVAA